MTGSRTWNRQRLLGFLTCTLLTTIGCSAKTDTELATRPSSEAPIASAPPIVSSGPVRENREKRANRRSDRPSPISPWATSAFSFVRDWLSEFNLAMDSGDTSVMRILSLPACKTCSAWANLTDEIYAEGGSISGEPWESVSTTTTTSPDNGDTVTIRMHVRQPPQTIRRTDGATTSENQTSLFVFTIVRRGEEWLMEEIALAS